MPRQNQISVPAVTIVVPVFNQAQFIERAINSIITQDCVFDIKVIVIDDGSTDDVRNILKKYESQIYVESRPNCGQSASLNYGWSLSDSEFIGYLSADDMLLPGAVQKSVQALIDHPDIDVVYGDFISIDKNDRKIRKVKASDFCFETMLLELDCSPGPGALFRSELLESVGVWDERLHRLPDYEFWLRVANVGKFKHLSEELAMWRVHEASQAFAGTSFERANESYQILERFFAEQTLTPKVSALRTRSLGGAYLLSAQLHARSGRFLTGLKRLYLAFCYDPTRIFKMRTYHIIVNAIVQKSALRIFVRLRDILRRKDKQQARPKKPSDLLGN